MTRCVKPQLFQYIVWGFEFANVWRMDSLSRWPTEAASYGGSLMGLEKQR